jgi:hypothetical protein
MPKAAHSPEEREEPMGEVEATKYLESAVVVTREDIARGKSYVLTNGGGETEELANHWLSDQGLSIPRKIDGDAPGCADVLVNVARAFSVRLALYQAISELVAAGELIPGVCRSIWKDVVIDYTFLRYSGGLRPKITCAFPTAVARPPLAIEPPTDPDIFLQGVDCKTLHLGIREAVEQALACFRRGLYMPATVMLAAAAEATWTECGNAVAKKLTNAKLQGIVENPYASISKKVAEIRKALEHPLGQILLKDAGQTLPKVTEAEAWTAILRDRRNALHWGKARSFNADHSDTASWLMGAPLHLSTLEAIRAAC